MDDWAEVYERYGSLVWTTVYRILGDHTESLDCCQDIFTELMNRPTAQPVRNWPAFLKWLATRRAIDQFRRWRLDAARRDDIGDVAKLPELSFSADDREDFVELKQRLKRELSRMPDRQAEAFWLFSVEQMSYAEIGEQMEIEVNQVGVLVHRARHKLRQWLADLQPTAREIRPVRKSV